MRCIFILLLFVCSFKVFSVHETIASGDFSNPEIWNSGEVPVDGSDVLIRHDVEIGNEEFNLNVLRIKAKIKFLHNNSYLFADSVVMENGTQVFGEVTGTMELNKLRVLGSSNIGRLNFTANNQVQISAPLSFNHSVGNVEIQNLQIDQNGVWNNFNSRRIKIHNINNFGNMLMGDARYDLSGVINSNHSIKVRRLKLMGDIYLNDSLNVLEEFIANDFCLINNNSGVLTIGTTLGNFNAQCLDLTAEGNVLIMNRASFQFLPQALHNTYYTVFLNNQGNVTILEDDPIIIQNLHVGEHSTVKINEQNFLNQFNTFKVWGTVESDFNSSDALRQFQLKFSPAFKRTSHWIWNVSDTVHLLDTMNVANLSIQSAQQAWLVGEDYQINCSGNLSLGSGVNWLALDGELDLGLGISGSGNFLDSLVHINIQSRELVSLSIHKMAVLNVQDVDSLYFPFSAEVDSCVLNNSSVRFSSVKLKNLYVDSLSLLHFAGLNNTVNRLIVEGSVKFTGSNANHFFQELILKNGAHFRGSNRSDFHLSKGLRNDGAVMDFEDLNANWYLENDSIELKGEGEIVMPRVDIGQNKVFNYGNWQVGSLAKGMGKVFNWGQIKYACNADLLEWETLGMQDSAMVVFNREGNQSINSSKLLGEFNLMFKNQGRKTLQNNIIFQGNLSIQQNCELYLDTFGIQVIGDDLRFFLLDSSKLLIGKINTRQSKGMPIGFENYYLDSLSTVVYQAKDSQEILTGFPYGNLELNCGAVDSAAFTFLGDSLHILGTLNLRKSALTLNVMTQKLIVKSDWIGPGNVNLQSSAFDFYGNGFNYGMLKMDSSYVRYTGSKNQRAKIADYTKLIVDKTGEGKLLTRGALGVLNIDVVWVKSGVFSLDTEETFVRDSLVIWDRVEVNNDIQNKHLHHVVLKNGASFKNLIDEDLFISGNIFNQGNIQLDSGTIHFVGAEVQQFVNLASVTLGKMDLDQKLEFSGNFTFNNQVLQSENSHFKNATVFFDTLAHLDQATYLADEHSRFYAWTRIGVGGESDFFGWGAQLKLSDNDDLGELYLEKNFNTNNLPVDGPVHFYYVIKPENDAPVNAQLAIDIPSDLEDVEDYILIKSEDDGMSFTEVNFEIQDNKWVANGVEQFSWWTGAKGATAVLNVQLIHFDVHLEELSWELSPRAITHAFACEYVTLDMDSSWIAFDEVEDYLSIHRYFTLDDFEPGYYQLYEITQELDTLKIEGAFKFLRGNQRDTNYVEFINQNAFVYGHTTPRFIRLINLKGQELKVCETCNSINLASLPHGIYILQYQIGQHRFAKKVLLQ